MFVQAFRRHSRFHEARRFAFPLPLRVLVLVFAAVALVLLIGKPVEIPRDAERAPVANLVLQHFFHLRECILCAAMQNGLRARHDVGAVDKQTRPKDFVDAVFGQHR